MYEPQWPPVSHLRVIPGYNATLSTAPTDTTMKYDQRHPTIHAIRPPQFTLSRSQLKEIHGSRRLVQPATGTSRVIVTDMSAL